MIKGQLSFIFVTVKYCSTCILTHGLQFWEIYFNLILKNFSKVLLEYHFKVLRVVPKTDDLKGMVAGSCQKIITHIFNNSVFSLLMGKMASRRIRLSSGFCEKRTLNDN